MVIKGWDGREIHGVCSGGSGKGVFSAFDWRDLVLGTGEPIKQKAARGSRHVKAYNIEAQEALIKRDGRYCSLQSISSEDTVTWSVFGLYDFWIGDLLSLVFGASACPLGRRITFWKRWPHPETGGFYGPEADVLIESGTSWSCAVEAKWLKTDIDGKQGRNRSKTQLEMRAACEIKNQLVIAPRPSRYPPATGDKIFPRYFEAVGDKYKLTSEASALPGVIRVITWEQIAELLDIRANAEPDAAEIVSYLRWRLDKLPEQVTTRTRQG